jgi:ABC-type transport system involved in multi-copper enzyme maturation permease subunit
MKTGQSVTTPQQPPAGPTADQAAAVAVLNAQTLIGRGRSFWRPLCYGLALLIFATALTVASPVSSWWWIYGLACEGLGLVFLPVAAVRFRQARDLRAATAALAANGGVIASFRPVPAQARPADDRPPAARVVAKPKLSPTGGLPGMRVTTRRAMRSEWTKFRSVRSSKIVLLVSAVLVVGMAGTVAALLNNQWDKLPPAARAQFDPAIVPMAGVGLAQFAVGVLGVLLISGEYATGMIRSSLTAVPQRLRFALAKFAVLVMVVGGVSLAATAGAFGVAQAVWARRHIGTQLGAPHTLRPVLGAALYLVLVAVLGMALGFLLRHTAAAIAGLVGLVFLAPIVVNFLPGQAGVQATKYLPGTAGQEFWSKPNASWAGLVILTVWVGGFCVLGVSRLLSEDV